MAEIDTAKQVGSRRIDGRKGADPKRATSATGGKPRNTSTRRLGKAHRKPGKKGTPRAAMREIRDIAMELMRDDATVIRRLATECASSESTPSPFLRLLDYRWRNLAQAPSTSNRREVIFRTFDQMGWSLKPAPAPLAEQQASTIAPPPPAAEPLEAPTAPGQPDFSDYVVMPHTETPRGFPPEIFS
jgi:hypothetical protein